MPAYVYLMPHHVERKFKIGKAVNIRKRIGSLGAEEFNPIAAKVVVLEDEDTALRIEKVLHRIFFEYQVKPDPNARSPGDTEWYGIECFDEVVELVGTRRHLFRNATIIDGQDLVEQWQRDTARARDRIQSAARVAEAKRRKEMRESERLKEQEEYEAEALRQTAIGAGKAVAALCAVARQASFAAYIDRAAKDRNKSDRLILGFSDHDEAPPLLEHLLVDSQFPEHWVKRLALGLLRTGTVAVQGRRRFHFSCFVESVELCGSGQESIAIDCHLHWPDVRGKGSLYRDLLLSAEVPIEGLGRPLSDSTRQRAESVIAASDAQFKRRLAA
jgi:hypothetical protein